jgi:hypothetical protein
MSAMRAPFVVRVALLLALLGGIVTMHAVAIVPGHHAHADTVTMVSAHHHADDTSCGDDGCGSRHTGMHGCVFVMTAVSVIGGLALLCWVVVGRITALVAQLFHHRRRRQRAPPWTVLSLFELSILRV